MSKPMGRSDDMLIVKGVNVFPSQIENGAAQQESYPANYQINVTRENNSDRLEVQVEMTPECSRTTWRRSPRARRSLWTRFKAMLGIYNRRQARGAEEHRAQRGQGVRVIDKRNLY